MKALSPCLLLSLLACSGKDSVTEDSSTDTDSTEDTQEETGEETGGDTSAPTPDGHAPIISSCDAWCELHQVGEEFYKWNLDCTVTDEEGLDNIWNGRTTIMRGGSVVADYLVACAAGTGNCTTAFREDEYQVTCSLATSYVFKVWVNDWDGNESLPFTVSGRQQ